jgi:hypothetical protein
MIQPTATSLTALDILQAYGDTFRKAPKLTALSFKRQAQRIGAPILAELRVEPPKWTGKRRWKSEKQRRAFFATDGFGKGIPYERTHELRDGWHLVVDIDESGGVFGIANDAPHMRFVQGDDAQPMHLDSGWGQEGTIVAKHRPEAEDRLIETWYTANDPYAGVRG